MSDANVRIPEEARDRLAAIAAAEGMSLRAYLARLADTLLTPAERAERGSYAGCVAGALSRSEYLDGLAAAGFVDATVEFTQEAADGMHNAVIRARKPV